MSENKPEENDAKTEEPKIIVDDDWKAQAQAEKEKLDQQAVAEDAQAPGRKPGPADQPRELPPASFAALVNSLVTQVILALGGLEDPKTKKRYVDLDLAKFHIDTLAVIEQKTKGNLTQEEVKLLDQALYDARMHYVQLAQQIAIR